MIPVIDLSAGLPSRATDLSTVENSYETHFLLLLGEQDKISQAYGLAHGIQFALVLFTLLFITLLLYTCGRSFS